MKKIKLLLVLGIISLLFCCSKSASYPYPQKMQEEVNDIYSDMDSEYGLSKWSKSEIQQNQIESPQMEAQKKQIFSGSASLIVENVEESKNEISTIAENFNGWIEFVRDQSIAIRIPADDFDTVFNQILAIGTVVNKLIESMDVTEFFQDVSGRLNIAIQTRERLYKLLEKTDDVDEHLIILKEIGRLTEEIERLRILIQTMEMRISYSRIVVQLQPRIDASHYNSSNIPFPWIAGLDPLSGSIYSFDGKIKYETPNSFAVFSDEIIYRAETAKGARMRIGTIDNKPEGDDKFWQKALSFHLQYYYSNTELFEYKDENVNYKGVIFTSKDRKPYYYVVIPIVRSKKLHVFELFFPDEMAYKLYFDEVKKSLSTLEVKK